MIKKMKPRTIIFCVVAVIVCSYFVYAGIDARLSDRHDSKDAQSREEDRLPVKITPVSLRHFDERFEVQGNLDAKNVAMVHPRVAATIESIYVDEGDIVIAGKIDGKERASIVFPLPGGPDIRILCPPAAAISRARLVCSCPFICARSILEKSELTFLQSLSD